MKLPPEKLTIIAALGLLSLVLLFPFRTGVAAHVTPAQRTSLGPCFIFTQPSPLTLAVTFHGAPKHRLGSEIDYGRTALCAAVVVILAGAVIIGIRATRNT